VLKLDARCGALGKVDRESGVDLEVGVLGGVSDERFEGVAEGVERVRLPETDACVARDALRTDGLPPLATDRASSLSEKGLRVATGLVRALRVTGTRQVLRSVASSFSRTFPPHPRPRL
jgi:hypothetical protein